MSDTRTCTINELPDKPNISQADNGSHHEGPRDEGSDESDSEGSASCSESATTDSYDEEENEGNGSSAWNEQIDSTRPGRNVLFVANDEEEENPVDSINSEEENCSSNGEKENLDTSINNSSFVSAASTHEQFEESEPVPFGDLDANLVADPLPIRNTEEPQTNLQEEACCGSVDWNEDEEASKIFNKNVPLSASDTWDYSLQAINKDFKSKVLWVEGTFYQKFIGKCYHEMHNVPCECDEKKKISVCRLCHAVFCSNKCFKRAMKVQTGEDADDGAAEEPELQPMEVKTEPKTEVKTNQQNKLKGETASNKKGYTPPKQNNQVETNPSAATERRNGHEYQRQPAHQKQYTDKNRFGSRQNGPSPFNMMPTQVLVGSSNPNKLSQEKSSQPQNRVGNNFANATTSVESQKHSEFGKYGSQDSRNFKWNEFRPTNLATGLGSQNQDLGTHSTSVNTSPAKEPPVRIPRNLPPPDFPRTNLPPNNFQPLNNPPPPPNPILSEPERQPQSFFNRRGRSNSSPSNSPPKNRSEGEQSVNPSENNRGARHNNNFDRTTSKIHGPIGQSHQSHNGNFSPNFKSSYELGKPQIEGKNVQPDRNRAMPEDPRQNRRDHHQTHKYPNNTGTEKYGRNQRMPFQHNSRENFESNRNQTSSSPHNNQSFGNENGYHTSRSDEGGNSGKYSRRSDHFHSGSRQAPFASSPNRSVKGYTQQEFTSSSSGYPFDPSLKSSVSSSSSCSSSTRTIVPVNQHSLQAHDTIGAPYGVLMTVKHVQGGDFHDFSVMTMRNDDLFKTLHPIMQTWGKVRMDIFEVNSHCLVKYKAEVNGLEDSQEKWYRGIITKDVVSNIGVYLMDLGIETVVTRDAVHELKSPLPRESRFGPLAIRLRALNVKVNNDDPDDIAENFKELVQDRPSKIRITHKDTTEAYKFGCTLHVQQIGKWFDAGVLLKKLLVGDQVPHEDILLQEAQHSIVPCKKFILRDELLPVSVNASSKTEVKVTHVISPNEFYVVPKHSDKILSDLENKIHKAVSQMKPAKLLKELSYSMFLWEEKGNPRSRARVRVVEACDTINGIKVMIQKVDTGEILTVSIEELRKLPPDLQKPTSCAYKCSLPIKPLSTSRDMPRSESITRFESAKTNLEDLKQREIYVCIKVFSVDDSSTHIVDLYVPNCKVGCTDTFCKNGWAELSQNVDLSLP